MIRELCNQKEIPTPQTERWGKNQNDIEVFIQRKHIVGRVSSYSPIGGHSVTRT